MQREPGQSPLTRLVDKDQGRTEGLVPAAALRSNEAQVTQLKNELRANRQQLQNLQDNLILSADDKNKLLVERVRLENIATELQRKVSDLEGSLRAGNEENAKSQNDVAKLRSEVTTMQASYIEDQIRIRELNQISRNAAVERNALLLERDRDIRDLMTARNLHIYDVFDTDSKGKTKPAFGRIFYTEGKSLVFYAYDLNEIEVQNASYHYRVWGSQESQKDRATSLGVFYSDDKSQRRWVFRCDDPKILSQIDSVFVTLEPVGENRAHPKGQKLLDAYLRGMPNHP